MKEDSRTPRRSASNYAMTGAHGPALRGSDADRPIPFFGSDDAIPYRLSVEVGVDPTNLDPISWVS